MTDKTDISDEPRRSVINALANILKEAQGVYDPERSREIDVGYDVALIRRKTDALAKRVRALETTLRHIALCDVDDTDALCYSEIAAMARAALNKDAADD